MREKKYRAWADGKMHYPTEEVWWYFSSTGYWSLNIGDGPGEIICDSLESENPHLMEYTGLKDKNDKEIFEGDIVSIGNMGTYEIVFDEGDYSTGFRKKAGENLTDIGKDFCTKFEIIGNVFETPEKVEP